MLAPSPRHRLATIAIVAWVALLALPNLLALAGPGASSRGAEALLLDDAGTSLIIGVLASVVLLALVGRYGLFAWLTLPFMVLMPVEARYVLEYGQPTGANVLGVLAETDAAEVREFLSGSMPAYVLAVVAFAAAAAIVALRLHRTGGAWTHRSRAALLAVVAGTAAVLFATQGLPDFRNAEAAARPGGLPDDAGDAAMGLSGIYPWGVPLRIAEYLGQRRAIDRRLAELESFRFHATLREGQAPRNVVLVLGESARPDHFALNGYARPTTPRLAAIDGTLSYRDVVSRATATRLAVPYIITHLPASGAFAASAFRQKSIVAAFAEAGYRTWWISNQASVGEHDKTIAPFAAEAGARRFLNSTSRYERTPFDEQLVGELRSALGASAKHRLVVLHTLGSHFNYGNRYPEAFDRFRPSLRDGSDASLYDAAHREAVVNAYDNTILYTDHVLADVVRALEATGEDSVMVYVSDHGQALFEGLCGKAGHGFPSATVYRVPLVLWRSKRLRERDGEVQEALAANRDKPLTVGVVWPTLAVLGGVDIPGLDRSASLAVAQSASQPRMVTSDGRQWLDFDRDLPPRDCALAGRATR